MKVSNTDRTLAYVSLRDAPWKAMQDDQGNILQGIVGRSGVVALSSFGHPMGVDEIVMEMGTAFPLHTHPGDHILYGLEGSARVPWGDTEALLLEGDTVHVPAEVPHGVRALTRCRFLAFGHPHKDVDSAERMKVVR